MLPVSATMLTILLFVGTGNIRIVLTPIYNISYYDTRLSNSYSKYSIKNHVN